MRKPAVTGLCVMLLWGACLSACMEAGEETLLADVTEEGTLLTDAAGETSGVSNASGEGEGSTEESRGCSVVLTEEEAMRDHLTAKLSDNVEIDACITPLSDYRDGLGMWDAEYMWQREHVQACNELDPDEVIQSSCTLEMFMDAMDRMTEKLGEVYVDAWEKCRNDQNFFCISTTGNLVLITKGDDNYSDGTYRDLNSIWYEGEDELPFLDRRTVKEVVEETIRAIFPDVERHGTFDVQTLERVEALFDFWKMSYLESQPCYFMEFAQTVEGIPVKNSWVTCRIEAGEISPDSMRYHKMYETEEYWKTGGMYTPFVRAVIGEDWLFLGTMGFYEFTRYREAEPVIGINEVLRKMEEILGRGSSPANVTEIELVMSETVVDEGEKKRIVLSPYWRVKYYREEDIRNIGKCVIRHYLTINAYTGEIVFHDWIP